MTKNFAEDLFEQAKHCCLDNKHLISSSIYSNASSKIWSKIQMEIWHRIANDCLITVCRTFLEQQAMVSENTKDE